MDRSSDYRNDIQKLSRAIDSKSHELRQRLAKSEADLAEERFYHARTRTGVRCLRDEWDIAYRIARVFNLQKPVGDRPMHSGRTHP